MVHIINGKEVAAQIKDEVREIVRESGQKVVLAIIQVGDNPASNTYIKNKIKACEYTGIGYWLCKFPENVEQSKVLEAIDNLNRLSKVTGIFVQLPLPAHLDEKEISRAISPSKDVDGFHPINVGKLWIGESGYVPCTPLGIVELLKRNNFRISGKHCVIVGRSDIVGKPMAALMLRENATVTIAHSKTKDLENITSRADILIVAIGKPKFITKDFIKDGAIVVDVGINRDGNNKLCGDVDFEDVADKCLAITPVPGGVGQMTVAMLLWNCINGAER